jgi:hypothetical protein
MESAWLVVRMSITAYVVTRMIDQLGIMVSVQDAGGMWTIAFAKLHIKILH